MSITSNIDNFFQTDADLEKREQRLLKLNLELGSPIRLPGKLIKFLVYKKKFFIVAGSDHKARMVNIETGKTVKIWTGHSGPVTTVAVYSSFEREGGKEDYLLTGSWDKTIRSWDFKDKSLLRIYQGHTDFVNCLAVADTYFFSGSADKTIRQWDFSTGQTIRVFEGHEGKVQSCICSSDRQRLYSSSSGTSIREWDVNTGECLRQFLGHETSIQEIRFSSEETDIWSASFDGTARRFDIQTGVSDVCFQHPEGVKAVYPTENNQLVITGCRDENVRVWDVATGNLLAVYEGHGHEITQVLCIGTFAYSASLDSTIRKWSILAEDMKTSETPKLKAPDGHLTVEEQLELDELMGDDD